MAKKENKNVKKKTSTKSSGITKKNSKTTSVKEVSTTKIAPKKEVKKEAVPKKEVVKEEKKEEIVKKDRNAVIRNVVIAVLVVILLIILFVLGNNNSKSYSKDTSSNTGNTSTQTTSGVADEASKISDDEKGDLTNVSIDQYLNLLKGDKYAIIYIGRPTCSHCHNQEPIMRYMVYKYGVTVNYLNTDELDSEGQNKLQKSNDYFQSGWGTPLILIVKDNKIVDKFEGETSIEDLKTMFEKYDLIVK